MIDLTVSLPVRIRRAAEDEIDELQELDVALGLGRVCPPSADTDWWGAWVGAELVGYAGGRLIESGAYYLSRAGVVPAYRGRGIQRRLIRARLLRGRQLGAPRAATYTNPHNIPSINNLIACGFRATKPWSVDADVWCYWRRDY